MKCVVVLNIRCSAQNLTFTLHNLSAKYNLKVLFIYFRVKYVLDRSTYMSVFSEVMLLQPTI